ncbi:hypothetical protein LWI29_003907 [Acer saccharum]|uniref:SHSP domain-containing protein n=1 Tax=Acer saccharum TaxID=4024 RepID=A0AA39T116_ACESA|nr:hypothetical protein LWI29_003907 [Acer saccharum]
MDSPSQFTVTPARDSLSQFMVMPATPSDATGVMAEEYRYLYGVVANKAEPFVESPPSMISDMALETRQTGDDNMTSKGKDVQVVAPVNIELHDGAFVYPHINCAAPSNAAGVHSMGEGSNLYDVVDKDAEPSATLAHVMVSDIPLETNRRDENAKSKGQDVIGVTPENTVLYDGPPMMHPSLGPGPTQDDRKHLERDSPAIIFLPSQPSKQEWADITAAVKSGFALTGSAAMGHVGPIIGLMDVGECEDSYLFRVALPGVKRDDSEFSCWVDPTGKVSIRGITTTGEKSVHRFSQVFEMKTQNLCPPGPFSMTFQLPGRVVVEEFSGNFGMDGILEGIVKKEKHTTPISQQ